MNIDTSTLKVGDEVAERLYGYGQPPFGLSRVEKITPSGQIVLANGHRYTKDGRAIGGGSIYHRACLELPTDEIRGNVKHHRLVTKLRARLHEWEKLPAETLERLYAVLIAEAPDA